MFKFDGIQSTGSGRSISYCPDVLDLGFVTIIGTWGSLSFILFVLVLGAGGYNRKWRIHILYTATKISFIYSLDWGSAYSAGGKYVDRSWESWDPYLLFYLFSSGSWWVYPEVGDPYPIHCHKNPIYVFPEKELCGLRPDFHIHVSVSDLFIPRIGLPILLEENMWSNPGNI
jgi:hypothetical protein